MREEREKDGKGERELVGEGGIKKRGKRKGE